MRSAWEVGFCIKFKLQTPFQLALASVCDCGNNQKKYNVWSGFTQKMVTSKAPPNRLRGTFVIASEPAFGSAPSDVIDERPFIERRENIAKSDAKTSEQNTYSRQIAFPLSSAFAIAQRARPTEGISAAFRAIQRNVFILPADSATKNRKTSSAQLFFFGSQK